MSQTQTNKRYWRSFDELQDAPDFQRAIDAQFAAAAPPAHDGLSRRRWLQLMGASIAFGSVAGCRMGENVIAPFAFRPAQRVPGVPDLYATCWDFAGVARPLLATSQDGRPIKLDGNPEHPAGQGGSDVFTQAMLLELYDPDRSRQPATYEQGQPREASWDQCLAEIQPRFAPGGGGRGVAVLSEPVSSPTLLRLKEELLKELPQVKWYEYSPINDDNARAGSIQALGAAFRPQYSFTDAKIIVALDADPIGQDVDATNNAKGFVAGRDADHQLMNRLYSVEAHFSHTGAMADHRLALRSGQIASFAAALEAEIDRRIAGQGGGIDSSIPRAERTLMAMADDLVKHRGQSLLLAGPRQNADVHARVWRINDKLGNLGKTIQLTELPGGDAPAQLKQISDLAGAMSSGEVQTLLILGGNPVYDAPRGAGTTFASALAQAREKGTLAQAIHLSVYRNETTRLCSWHVNGTHPMEQWSDGVSYDGTWCIGQPLVEPLFGGRSAIELLATLLGSEATGGLENVRQTASDYFSAGDFSKKWERAVHDGFFAGSAPRPATASLKSMDLGAGDDSWKQAWSGSTLELIFTPSSHVYDGRFANNSWLQETPDFVTKLTWDNAALVAPKTAAALGLHHETLVDLTLGEQSLRLPVFVLPGQAQGTICVAIGYGRTAAGRVGGDVNRGIAPVGVDVNDWRSPEQWSVIEGVEAIATSTHYPLATTQEHFRFDALGQREINKRMGHDSAMLRQGTYESYLAFQQEHGAAQQEDHSQAEPAQGHAHWPPGHHEHFPSFDLTPPAYSYSEDFKWGMAIDLNKCIGCNACITACQAENNIPVVGREQVLRSREMHWIRVDRYFITDEDDLDAEHPELVHQPVTCQQCEKAPCETVCPVAATTHSDDGLNDMVYNRCIGTRYCANNCPYKVRRFNYFNYTDAQTFLKIPGDNILPPGDRQLQNLIINPEVTIRSRGVMEKCTFCVQRIRNGQVNARNSDRPLGPNEVQTACQMACPTRAIEFGNLSTKLTPGEHSNVRAAHENPRSYVLLDVLNVTPRNKYLARVRNPHPALAADSTGSHAAIGSTMKETV